MFRTFWLRSLKSALAFSPSARRLRPSRPRTEHRCFFRPQLEPLEQRRLLSTMAAIDPVSGSLSLFGAAAGSSVEVEGLSNGSVGVLVNGQFLSSVSTATLRQISLTGGGAADALTLNNLTGRDLTLRQMAASP